jgi:hypothetical protein
VRRNWQAIFDAEPGFRLTVLRSASVDDTIWLELHGAGEDAEVAGVFVMGIQGDRIRWARIYSALVEPVPEGVGQSPAQLREVPRHDQPVATNTGEVVEESLIAPVLDMDRGGSRRRRRRGEDAEGEGEPPEAGAAEADEEGGEVTAVISGNADMATAVVEADDHVAVAVTGADDHVAVVENDEVAVVVEGDAEVAVVEDDDTVSVVVEGDAPVVVDAGPEADVAVAPDGGAGEPPSEAPVEDDGGPPTAAVDMVTITTDTPDEPPEPEEPPRRSLFGRKH